MSSPVRIGFLLWPGLTQLDLTGPAQLLARMPGAEPLYAWKDLAPVPSDCGLALLPSVRLADCPRLDLLLVPGGGPVATVMRDAKVLGWLRRQAAGARLVTSVCTGSLVLAAAGLLRGRAAACHWSSGHLLALFGARFARGRVVADGPFLTAAGVTAGIDLALAIAARLHGADTADAIRLAVEWDPAPSSGGTPETARPEVLARVRAEMAGRLAAREAEVAAIARHQAAAASA